MLDPEKVDYCPFFKKTVATPHPLTYYCLLAMMVLPACRQIPDTVAEPQSNPHSLGPGIQWTPREWITVDSFQPQKIDIDQRYERGITPTYTAFPASYRKLGKFTYVADTAQALVREVNVLKVDGKLNKFSSAWGNWSRGLPITRSNSFHHFSYLSVEQGLGFNRTFALIKDRRGHIWIGGLGVCTWDGLGFTPFLPEQQQSTFSTTGALLEDSQGNIWIGAREGIYRWDGSDLYHLSQADGLLFSDITSLVEDQKGNIWIGSRKGGLSFWDGQDFQKLSPVNGRLPGINALLEDRYGNIWIGTDHGLGRWDGKYFTLFNRNNGLSQDNIKALAEDQHGKIWIGTYGGGINVWDGSGFTRFQRNSGLSTDWILSLFRDSQNRIWIGTEAGGANVWDGSGFTHYTQSEGLSDASVRAFLEDDFGNIWMATSNGGLSILRDSGFQYFSVNNGLSSSYIDHLEEDEQGNIWIGTGFNGINVWDGKGLRKITEREGLLDNRIWCIFKDRSNRIWISYFGFSDHFSVWDGEGFTHFNETNGFRTGGIRSFAEDKEGRIWMGTARQGTIVWDGSSFWHYFPTDAGINPWVMTTFSDRSGNIWIGTRENSPENISGTIILWNGSQFSYIGEKQGFQGGRLFSFFQDEEGRIWIGGRFGLNIWNGKSFSFYSTKDGLKDRRISEISSGLEGETWIGGPSGLNRLYQDRGALAVEQFLNADGLEGVTTLAMLTDRNKRLWIGSPKGLSVHPMKKDTSRPQVHIREIQPFFSNEDWRAIKDSLNGSISHVEDGNLIYQFRVDYDSVVPFANLPANPRFSHQTDRLTIHWVGIQHIVSHKLQYSYRLEGKDRNWSPPRQETSTVYSNLAAGHYRFKVRALGSNGRWSQTQSYAFTILPPWWKTSWAYLVYALCLVSGLYSLYQYLLNRRMKRLSLEQELALNTYTTSLYTNITHEFRTPLTVILGMVRQIRANPQKWYREGMEMIERNGGQLLQLVNQMLDLSKLDKGKLSLKPRRGDLVDFIQYLLQNYESFATVKGIQIHFLNEMGRLEMDFDPDQISRIFTNLVSNAIKFTPQGGHIYLTVRTATVPSPTAVSDEWVNIVVRDTGEGIPPEEIPYIFDRFYQVDRAATRRAEGTGIGLSLVKELVALMEGEIWVDSQLNRGTTFSLHLPIRRSASPVEKLAYGPETAAKNPSEMIQTFHPAFEPIATSGQLPTVLLVEDNPDILRYLAACLEHHYQLEYAKNGKEGLEQALEIVPDLIVSDVMMPEMDGYIMTATLKQDERTSHIPILLLTAKADKAAKIEGLERGADAYLTKPFEPQELEVRMRKLIQLRQQLQRKYSAISAPGHSGDQAMGPEDLFMGRFRKVVEEHLEDETFGIVQTARKLGISRTQLHNKIKALTGGPTSRAIRLIRLQRARTLLLESDRNVSEVAYAVGFKSATYFSSCFAEEYGYPPSELKA